MISMIFFCTKKYLREEILAKSKEIPSRLESGKKVNQLLDNSMGWRKNRID